MAIKLLVLPYPYSLDWFCFCSFYTMYSCFQDEGVQVSDDQGAGDLPQPAQGPGQGRVVHITLCRNIDGYARS